MRKLLPRTRGNADRSLGFTLIELLVVVAIISVLLAILLPAFGVINARAKRVACASNLRQLAAAWLLYLEDNDQHFYKGLNAYHDYGGWRGSENWWPRPLNKHAGLENFDGVSDENAKVFLCPADRGGVPDKPLEKAYNFYGTSYHTNTFLIGPSKEWNSCEGTSLEFDAEAKIFVHDTTIFDVDVNHELVLLMGDEWWYNHWLPFDDEEWLKLQEIGEWHGKKEHYNMAFLGGNVDFVRIRKQWYWVEGEWSILPSKRLRDLAPKPPSP